MLRRLPGKSRQVFENFTGMWKVYENHCRTCAERGKMPGFQAFERFDEVKRTADVCGRSKASDD